MGATSASKFLVASERTLSRPLDKRGRIFVAWWAVPHAIDEASTAEALAGDELSATGDAATDRALSVRNDLARCRTVGAAEREAERLARHAG
jgi:hypothetical protein